MHLVCAVLQNKNSQNQMKVDIWLTEIGKVGHNNVVGYDCSNLMMLCIESFCRTLTEVQTVATDITSMPADSVVLRAPYRFINN